MIDEIKIDTKQLAYDVFNRLDELGFRWKSDDFLNDFEFYSFKELLRAIEYNGCAFAIVYCDEMAVGMACSSVPELYNTMKAEEFFILYSEEIVYPGIEDRQINTLL